MMRTTGFLAGVCLTIAAFLLVLYTRQDQRQEIAQESIAGPTSEELSAVVAAIADQVDIVPADSESMTDDAEPQDSLAEATAESTQDQPAGVSTAIVAQADVIQAEQESGMTVPPAPVFPAPDDHLQNGVEASGMAQGPQAINEHSSNTGTYLFWSPFRSTWAAQGFAGRLTLATQVPVDVVNTAPGQYRVAFSFQDETERLERIERIETITGLNLE